MKNMTGRGNVTIDEMYAIRPEIDNYINKSSIILKVWGMLSLVNLIWFVSIVGLTASALPCIKQIFSPIIIFLM